MDTTPNYYQLLHVLPDAPAPVIKASYRAMMQKLGHHPDLGGDPSLAQMLNLAVDTLCDPVRRAQYDRQQQAADKLATSSSHTTQTAQRQQTSSTEASSPTSKESDAERSQQQTKAGKHRGPGYTSEQSSSRKSSRDSSEQASTQTASGQHQHGHNAPPATKNHLPARPHCLFCGATHATGAVACQPYDAGKHCLRCDAPSVPMEALPQSMSDELRRIYRHECEDAVTLWSHWPKDTPLSASLQDLSLAGCAIECSQPLTDNAMVLLETARLTAICQVRYCQPEADTHQYQIGLEFRMLDIKAQPGSVFSAIA